MRWILLIGAALAAILARLAGLDLPAELAVVTAFVYGNHLVGQYSATAARRIDFVTDTTKMGLTTSTYTPNQDTHTFYSDITNEVVGTGYTAGGVALAGKSISYDSASNETRMIAGNPSWATATITARFSFAYKDTANAATSPLICYGNFGADQAIAGGLFGITLDATGLFKVAAA